MEGVAFLFILGETIGAEVGHRAFLGEGLLGKGVPRGVIKVLSQHRDYHSFCGSIPIFFC